MPCFAASIAIALAMNVPAPQFNFLESAKRFCQAFDEVQQFLRPRTRMTELVSLSKQREHFIE